MRDHDQAQGLRAQVPTEEQIKRAAEQACIANTAGNRPGLVEELTNLRAANLMDLRAQDDALQLLSDPTVAKVIQALRNSVIRRHLGLF